MAGYTAIDHRKALFICLTKNASNVILIEIAMTRRQAFTRKEAVTLPAANRGSCPTYSPSEIAEVVLLVVLGYYTQIFTRFKYQLKPPIVKLESFAIKVNV